MYSNIFDSHAHYDSEKFDVDRRNILQTLPHKGIKAVMNVSSNNQSALISQKYAKEYDYMYCSAGIHPHYAKDTNNAYIKKLGDLAGYEKCMAIGEIGLDYYYDFSPREQQKNVFTEQIKLALELDLPVIIHARDAHQDVMDVLKKYRPMGIIHCYSGSPEMATELVKLGFYIGFTGVLTFDNAKRARQSVAVIPNERLLIETDCPYMAPTPYRGKRSDSLMLPEVASVMAGIKGTGTQEMIDITCKNAFDIYRIKN